MIRISRVLNIWLPSSVNGNDNRRYSSSLATKGVGHLARKGTGGRSSVRYLSFWFLKKCYLVCVRITPSLVCSSLYSSFELKNEKKKCSMVLQYNENHDLSFVFASGIVATVFGATGFLGRYLVQQLGDLRDSVLFSSLTFGGFLITSNQSPCSS